MTLSLFISKGSLKVGANLKYILNLVAACNNNIQLLFNNFTLNYCKTVTRSTLIVFAQSLSKTKI